MDTLRIEKLESHLKFRGRVLDWLVQEWGGDRDELDATLDATSDRPGAIIALSVEQPIGVLAFKRYQGRAQTRETLWINALFVVPESRRRDVGSQLVRVAMRPQSQFSGEELFVYTDQPELYGGLGWEMRIFNPESNMHTLAYGPTEH